MMMYASLILIGTFISSISQILLKKASMKKYSSLWEEYLNPMVIIAYTMFVGTTFLSILAYRGIPLSLGPVLESTGYIYITIFGVLIFKEKVNCKKIIALTLIIMGIWIYSVLG